MKTFSDTKIFTTVAFEGNFAGREYPTRVFLTFPKSMLKRLFPKLLELTSLNECWTITYTPSADRYAKALKGRRVETNHYLGKYDERGYTQGTLYAMYQIGFTALHATDMLDIGIEEIFMLDNEDIEIALSDLRYSLAKNNFRYNLGA